MEKKDALDLLTRIEGDFARRLHEHGPMDNDGTDWLCTKIAQSLAEMRRRVLSDVAFDPLKMRESLAATQAAISGLLVRKKLLWTINSWIERCEKEDNFFVNQEYHTRLDVASRDVHELLALGQHEKAQKVLNELEDTSPKFRAIY